MWMTQTPNHHNWRNRRIAKEEHGFCWKDTKNESSLSFGRIILVKGVGHVVVKFSRVVHNVKQLHDCSDPVHTKKQLCGCENSDACLFYLCTMQVGHGRLGMLVMKRFKRIAVTLLLLFGKVLSDFNVWTLILDLSSQVKYCLDKCTIQSVYHSKLQTCPKAVVILPSSANLHAKVTIGWKIPVHSSI